MKSANKIMGGKIILLKYSLIVTVGILLICSLVWIITHFFIKSDKETEPSTMLITSGIALVVSAFPGTEELLLGFLGTVIDKKITYGPDYIAIFCGIALIVLGMLYQKNIKDRIFVLNMFGIPVQKEISTEDTIKDLKLADYKVKEIIIEFVDIFKLGIDESKNEIIVQKIKKICTEFVNRSKDFKVACFTGMSPIPYTILAGTYLENGNVKRYFEKRRSDSKYYELSKKKKKYDSLKVTIPNNINNSSTDVVVALSVTKQVQDCDITQFAGKDIIKIGLDVPGDNIIETNIQVNDYAQKTVDEIENLKNKYPHLQRVHFVASIPSCLSIELGKRFALNSNRLAQIISYHYVNTETPKYPFGIVVADGRNNEVGKYVR